MQKTPKNHKKLLTILVIIGLTMFGLSYAFVPLYNAFCRLIGTPTATIQVYSDNRKELGEISDREITIRFIGKSADGVPVTLKPIVSKIKLRLNEPYLTAYTAKSESNKGMQGVAIHTLIAFGNNGEEGDVSGYVDLQQCFCFEEQYYPAGEEIHLPLSFFVTEDLPKSVHTINFAYTLFETAE